MQTYVTDEGRSYFYRDMNAFDAACLFATVQKKILPCLKDLREPGGALHGVAGSDIMNMDVFVLIGSLSQSLDKDFLQNCLLPLFSKSFLGYKTKEGSVREFKENVDPQIAFDIIFTRENACDVWKLAWEVAKYQFSPFLPKNILSQKAPHSEEAEATASLAKS